MKDHSYLASIIGPSGQVESPNHAHSGDRVGEKGTLLISTDREEKEPQGHARKRLDQAAQGLSKCYLVTSHFPSPYSVTSHYPSPCRVF